jgi:MFS family permease
MSSSIWQFILVHFAIGLSSSATFGPLMAEASHWFDRYRGLAVAVAASGNYIGGAIWPPLINHGIETMGWRTTHIAIGIFTAVAMTLALIGLRMLMGAGVQRDHENAPPPRVDLRLSTNALTAMLSLAAIACCVAMSMPQVHIVAYCGDLGYGVARGAEMLSLMLGFRHHQPHRLGLPRRQDRRHPHAADRLGGAGHRAVVLSVLRRPDLALHHLAMFGLFQGGIVPSYAIIVREAMPASEAATRVGIVIFASVFGMSFGGWISGAIFDATGSYGAAFANGLAWNALQHRHHAAAVDARAAAAGDGVRADPGTLADKGSWRSRSKPKSPIRARRRSRLSRKRRCMAASISPKATRSSCSRARTRVGKASSRAALSVQPRRWRRSAGSPGKRRV